MIKQKLKAAKDNILSCSKCDLHYTKREYVPGIIGTKRPDLVFIGEAPGAWEDLYGEPFGGPSGSLLMKCIKEAFGLDRYEFSILNTLKCRPPDNRDPTKHEKEMCSPHLYEQLNALKPCTIIPLGLHASNTFTGQKMTMRDLLEICFVDVSANITIYPCYHPAYIIRNATQRESFVEEFRRIANGARNRTKHRCSIFPSTGENFDGYCSILPR